MFPIETARIARAFHRQIPVQSHPPVTSPPSRTCSEWAEST
jgi:hypothetical protein